MPSRMTRNRPAARLHESLLGMISCPVEVAWFSIFEGLLFLERYILPPQLWGAVAAILEHADCHVATKHMTGVLAGKQCERMFSGRQARFQNTLKGPKPAANVVGPS